MNHYEAKQEARRERLLARAEKLDRISAARYKNAMAQIEGIPPGQPILVGHHSERGHRAALARHDVNMRKGIEAQKAAARARAAADSVGSAGISSDDPDAPEKIKERIAALEARQEKMKAANAALRKGDDAALKAMGYSEASIAELKVPQWGNGRGPIGYPDYALSNNSANIRRLKARLVQVENNAQREHKEEMIGNSGIKIVENVEENRLQIVFPGKPEADIRAKLKSHGFRWSPTAGAWQRQLNNAARWAAKHVLEANLDG